VGVVEGHVNLFAGGKGLEFDLRRSAIRAGADRDARGLVPPRSSTRMCVSPAWAAGCLIWTAASCWANWPSPARPTWKRSIGRRGAAFAAGQRPAGAGVAVGGRRAPTARAHPRVVSSIGPPYDCWLSIQDDTRDLCRYPRHFKSCRRGGVLGDRRHSGGDFAPVWWPTAPPGGQRAHARPARPAWNELINGSMDVHWVEFQAWSPTCGPTRSPCC